MVVSLAVPVASSEDEEVVGTVTAILYALAELAVDTESNAAKLVSLEQRVVDLEAELIEKTQAASQK